MFIGKVARLAGTTVKSIRHYEAIGLLPEPQREGKYRTYGHDTVERLSLIKNAQQLGFKLKEIQTILGGPQTTALSRDLIARAIDTKKTELAGQILDLQRMLHGLHEFERRLAAARAPFDVPADPA